MTEGDARAHPVRSRHWLARPAWVCLGLLVLGAAYFAWWAEMEHRWTVVVDGQLYQSRQMPDAELLRYAQEHELHAVIDLREDDEAAARERTLLRGAGIAYYHVPSRQVPTAETIARFHRVIDECGKRPILIHCKHGEGRSVLFAALWRMEMEGIDNQVAWDGTTKMPPLLRGIPFDWLRLNSEKRAFLMGYQSRARLAARRSNAPAAPDSGE